MGRGTWVQYQKTFKMVFDTSLLNTQQYKVCIKGKVEQSRERSDSLSYTSVRKLSKREPPGLPRQRTTELFEIELSICI